MKGNLGLTRGAGRRHECGEWQLDDFAGTAGAVQPLRLLAEQAFSRAAGAPLVQENRIQLLKNAEENYPAWLDAIGSARKTVHFESYIIHADDVGNHFADLLCAKARDRVRVRVIYDWFGARGASSWRFWRRLRQAGVEVRCFNPPRFDSPLGWLSRDHRKTITVDGRIGFVSGLCVGQSWVGDPKRGIEPWRDTGVVIEGPAVFDLEQAFAAMWAGLGAPVPEGRTRSVRARQFRPSGRRGPAESFRLCLARPGFTAWTS